MFYTIYKITNTVNGKIYIGKHQTKNTDDSYFGSGIALKKAICKHGRENFKKEVLFVFKTENEMNEKEKEIITEEFVARKDTYNIGIGGEGGAHFKGKKHSKDTIEHIKQFVNSPESLQRLIISGRKIGLSSKGRKLSEKARKNMSEGAKKRWKNNLVSLPS